MIQNIWEKKLHLFTLYSITRHCFSLYLVGSKSMLALLPFKITITPRHWNDKCFHRVGGDLICRFRICASHFPCIVGAQQEILCLTVRTTWLIWRVWPRSLGMSVRVWQRHREVEWIEKCATKTQHFVASTPFVHNSVSHDHIVVPFMTFFGSFNWPRLPSWIGFFTAAWRWQWQHVRAARARSSKQNTRANSVFCLQIWPSIKSRAINGFNKCVFGFYSHWKVWYKSEKAFGMCSEWHYTTRGLAYGDMTTRPTGSLSCLHPPISLVV